MINENNLYEETNIGNLKISGSGSSGGGTFNEVSISGSGEVNGNLQCNTMRTSGSSRVNGNIKAKVISTSGSSKVRGNVDAEELKTSGSCKIEGSVYVNKLSSSGSTKIGEDLRGGTVHVSGSGVVGGNINLDEITISGSVDIGGDCETGYFKANGGFKIAGLLNSDNIEITVGGACRVKEIGGAKIRVSKGRHGLLGLQKLINLFLPFDRALETNVIEGDDIFLEYTKANVVRGNNVVIGEDSVIELVEYSGSLEVLPGAIVKEERKLS
jgi:cytoskeletal protein CcmA (bactofilin family)